MSRLRVTAIHAIALAIALAVPSWRERLLPWWYQPALERVKTWEFQLQDYHVNPPGRTKSDLLVIDYARSSATGGAMVPFTAAEVEQLKRKSGGGRRLVLSYLSIGEAEEYRWYWNPQWKARPPAWIIGENCRWPSNHLVRFWDREWKDIIYQGPASYLARILAAGFDGIYLDRIDVYDDIKKRFPDARAQMVDFMIELAGTARAANGKFLVIAQNAEDLIGEQRYRAVIDGLAKEDLLYGVDGTGRRNDKGMIDWSLGQIRQLQKDGRKVLAVEYLRSAEQIASARTELKSLGIAGVYPPRALDGTDPLVPLPFGQSEADRYGTPEYQAKNCNGVFHRS